MPGIAGVIAPAGARLSSMAERMLRSMQLPGEVVVRRIADSDLGIFAGQVHALASDRDEASASSVRGSVELLLNGECFDTSIGGPADVLALYERTPDTFAAELNGLFSGLLVDGRRKLAFLFNDRYGSERLYVHEHDGCVYFATQAKALLAVLPLLRAFDEGGVADFLTFGSVLQGRTLFNGLHLLPGGSVWRFAPGEPTRRERYFTPSQWESLEAYDAERFEQALIETFRKVLPAYARPLAGHPVGISLTAGLDTRMIMAGLPDGAPPPVTYTYAAQRGETFDVRIARKVAGIRGLSHASLRLPPSFIDTMGQHVDRTVHITDGCAGLLGTHELPLSEQARELSPIRLTGNFGSEVLRSMSTFKPIGLDAGLTDATWAARMQRAEQRVRARTVHPVTHAAFEEIPWHLSGTLLAARSRLKVRTPFMDNAIVELAYRAPVELRRSAHSSLRLVHEIRPALAVVPTDRGLAWGTPKWRMLPRRVFAEGTFKLDYWHKEGLPRALSWAEPLFDGLDAVGLLGLHKFLPYRPWFRKELAPWLSEVVAEVRRRRMPFWNDSFLAHVVDDHVSGRHNRVRELHAIVTLEAVDRLLLRADSPLPESIQATAEENA